MHATTAVLVPHEPNDVEIAATAGRILTEAARTVARHEHEAAQWAEQDLRPRTCIHGAYLWVDHDIPCGACEMGEDPCALTVAEALRIAREIAEAIATTHLLYLSTIRRGVRASRKAGLPRAMARHQIQQRGSLYLSELRQLSEALCWIEQTDEEEDRA